MKAQGRRPHGLTPIALLALALCASGARADEPRMPKFSFNGFGTLGLVHSSEKLADFTSTLTRPSGAGYTHAWSADVDSRIGVQLSAEFTPGLSAILQVISEQNYDDSYRPHVEWANIRYQFAPNFSIRAGRVVLPSSLVADYRKVGYAIAWVRPPVELYGMVPVTNSDGVDVNYRVRFGDLTNTLRGTYGKSKPKFPRMGAVKGKDVWSLSYAGEYGAATVQLTYVKAKVTLEGLRPLFDGFRQFGLEGVALANKYDVNNKPFEFIGLGAMYDPGRWFVMGEWRSGDTRSVFGKRTAWYASGGYRIGKFTPYLVYAKAKANSNTSDPALTLSALPPPLAGAAAGLNAGLNAILESIPVQKTLSVGLRWDLAKNAALKMQLDHSRVGADSRGTLVNIQPGFQPGGRFTVFSATLDFVF